MPDSTEKTQNHLRDGLCTGELVNRLAGPELDESPDFQLRKNETQHGHHHPMSPEEVPFLLRFPVTFFGMVLGTTSQSVVWLNLSQSPVFGDGQYDVLTTIHMIIWCLGLTVLVTISVTYLCKVFFWWDAINREVHHPFRLSFFFGPLLGTMFLANGTPFLISDRTANLPDRTPPSLAMLVMTFQLIGELYVYREWIFSEKLSIRNNNPSYQISVVGNFVGAGMLARAGLRRLARFFWSVGVLFWLLIFISLFQTISKEARKDEHGRRADIWRFPSTAHPTLFLFIAAPSAASTAWTAIEQEFDGVSVFFQSIGLFIYMFMLLQIRVLIQTPFTRTWWAYTFPMAAISIATTRYAESDPDDNILKNLALILSCFSSFMVLVVLGFTLRIHYRTDWTIDPKSGKIKCQGLFGLDPVIEVCLHDMGKTRKERVTIQKSSNPLPFHPEKQHSYSCKPRASIGSTQEGKHSVYGPSASVDINRMDTKDDVKVVASEGSRLKGLQIER